MKLFTKEIDKKLFAQYSKGADLESQMVVAKIFNPYGRGTWYILNSDPEDPDYLWAIVDLFEVEMGSVSRSELETLKVPPFRLPLERDMSFTPINAAELYRGLLAGKKYAEGGEISIEAQNKDMLLNYAEELEHHVKEFEVAAKGAEKVMPWVIAKIERASTDLSDVTHYLASENEKRREYGNGEGEEEYAQGGEIKWADADYGDNALVVSENKMGIIIKPYGRKFHLKFVDGTEKTYDASELKFFKDSDDFDRGGEVKEFNIMYFKKIPTRDGSLMEVMRERDIATGSLEKVLSKAYNNFMMSDVRAMIVDRQSGANAATVYPNGKGEVYKDGYGLNVGEVELEKEVEVEEVEPKKKKLFGLFAKGGVADPMATVNEIGRLSGVRPVAIAEWGDKNAVNLNSVLKDLKSKKIKGMDLMTAIVGNPNNKYSKKILGGYKKMAEGGLLSEGENWKVKELGDSYYPYGLYLNNQLVSGLESNDKKTVEEKKKEILKRLGSMAKGGVTFADKVKSIKSSLLKRKKVSPKVQKDYGKTYSPKEAEESAKRIVGAMTAKERLMAKKKKGKK